MLSLVFRPGRIGSLSLSSRILMGSMHLSFERAERARELAAFYAERALGGAALIITGGSAVNRVGAGGRLYSFINEPEATATLQPAVHAVHAAGGRIALQLFHAGRYGSEKYFGLRPLAPSAVESRFSRTPPVAMSGADIAATLDDFAQGARRARELGFDAVEIMGSEGYLLNQFLAPLTNRREDEWGGDLARRARFPLEVVRAVRAAVGAAFPLIYRLSGADLMPGGSSESDTQQVARWLAEAGIDAFDLGIGWHESSVPTVQSVVAPLAWIGAAERIKAAVGPLPVIASTRIPTLEMAERALERGLDFVAMARPFLADAALVAKARAGRAANPCIACNQACIDRSLRDEEVSCLVNPRAGHELELPEPHWRDSPPSHVRIGARASAAGSESGAIAVIGGGPAGLEAARVAATLGHAVTLFEAAAQLGGQFRLASRIPGKEIFADTIDYFEAELGRLGVQIRLGQRIEAASLAELAGFAGLIVASGVTPRPIALPGIELAHVRHYPEALLNVGTAQTHTLAIVGAGGIGVDVAHLYSQRGCAVALMCRGAVIGSRIGRSTRWVVMKSLREREVQLLTGVSYERIVPEGILIHQGGERRLIQADTVVIAAGQLSQTLPSQALEQLGRPFRVIGGARLAEEVDAVRAFREGAIAAHELSQLISSS